MARLGLCGTDDATVFFAMAVVVATSRAPVPAGAYGVVEAVEYDEVELELDSELAILSLVVEETLLVNDVLEEEIEVVGAIIEDFEAEEDAEEDEEATAPLEILKGALPFSG